MAGIIAGRDDAATNLTDARDFVGVAPDARLVSVEVGTASGAVDVSQLIAAIDWVVQRRRDNGLNIRVLNLSLGTDSVQPYTLDPLMYAAEVAWRKGITVVVAAGNQGTTRGRLQQRPTLTPDQPKTMLTASARPPAGFTAPAQARAAWTWPRPRRPPPRPAASAGPRPPAPGP